MEIKMAGTIGKGQIRVVGMADADTVINGGTEIVVGGDVFNTTINDGGVQDVYHRGRTHDVTINDGGLQNLREGATAYNTVINSGGVQDAHGNAFDTIVNSGGVQDLWGASNTAVIHSGGFQVVESGGIAGYTYLMGGAQVVKSGGGAGFTYVEKGGVLYDWGGTAETDIGAGGKEIVFKGGRADETKVETGGLLSVQAGGTAKDMAFGGTNATLDLALASDFTGYISGWQAADKIDLHNIKSGAGATFAFSENAANTGGVLTISDGATVAKLNLIGQFTNADFALSADGSGGVIVSHPVEMVAGPPAGAVIAAAAHVS
ncbi:hypothetical protein XI06_27435 [Bradyrhizobium sp. CCBAU 11434]|nr:hypothetical protein [Bradyrhizobium sp. CCBAU 11434]